MYHDEFSMSLVPVGDSQIPSYVDDSQPLSDTPMTDSSPSLVVHQFLNNAVAAVNRRIPKVKGTMKWLAHMSNFVLRHMSTLVKSGIRTDKGFKEVHLTACAKALFEHCGVEVTSTQVYNHLRKWRLRWIQVVKLRDLSGAQWCEETHTIILEQVHCVGHISVNTPPLQPFP